jgi:predicted nucleic acid-binding Zn ribbon protein
VTVKVGQHEHCRNCRRAVPIGEDFCGADCRREHKEDLRRKRNQMYFIIILGAIVVLLTTMLPLLGGP